MIGLCRRSACCIRRRSLLPVTPRDYLNREASYCKLHEKENRRKLSCADDNACSSGVSPAESEGAQTASIAVHLSQENMYLRAGGREPALTAYACASTVKRRAACCYLLARVGASALCPCAHGPKLSRKSQVAMRASRHSTQQRDEDWWKRRAGPRKPSRARQLVTGQSQGSGCLGLAMRSAGPLAAARL